MRILLLAPHPFYTDRGTPIDVLLMVRVLSGRPNTLIDVVTYHEGGDVDLPNVVLHRISKPWLIRGVMPGFSLKKIVCDVFMLLRSWSLIRRYRYELVHAGEESVYMAMLFRLFYGIPYVYDVDSSVAMQLVEQMPVLAPVARVLDCLERWAIRGAVACFPVCNALADRCRRLGSKKTFTIHDISQLDVKALASRGKLRERIGVEGILLVYVGNLQTYQGIDLALEAFRFAAGQTERGTLVIVGGSSEQREQYRRKAQSLGITERTVFVEPWPFERLAEVLADADVLLCPRTKGINTPMKVFSYLHSGKPVLLTDLPTHTQIITPDIAFLAPATPEGYGGGMVDLIADAKLRKSYGAKGRAFVEAGHVYEAHKKRVNEAYGWVEAQL